MENRVRTELRGVAKTTIEVKVGRKHITDGKPNSPTESPVALALMDMEPVVIDPNVDTETLDFMFQHTPFHVAELMMLRLDQSLIDWHDQFDRGGAVTPIKVTAEWYWTTDDGNAIPEGSVGMEALPADEPDDCDRCGEPLDPKTTKTIWRVSEPRTMYYCGSEDRDCYSKMRGGTETVPTPNKVFGDLEVLSYEGHEYPVVLYKGIEIGQIDPQGGSAQFVPFGGDAEGDMEILDAVDMDTLMALVAKEVDVHRDALDAAVERETQMSRSE